MFSILGKKYNRWVTNYPGITRSRPRSWQTEKQVTMKLLAGYGVGTKHCLEIPKSRVWTAILINAKYFFESPALPHAAQAIQQINNIRRHSKAQAPGKPMTWRKTRLK
jgi:hypothetical protein